MIVGKDKKLLERYLNKLKLISENGKVNYTETEKDKDLRRERAKKDYKFFVEYYFPHYADCETADFQIEEANRLLKDKQIKLIEEWARGLAKSTHFDIFIPIWLHLFHDQLKCMLLVGKNQQSANRLLSDLQAEFTANEQIKHDFGSLVQQGSWEEGNFITKSGAAFYALGKGQSPRGLKNGPNRPDYIVLDDIDDDEECRNPRRVDQTVDWVLRALIPAMGSEITRFVMVNNRIAKHTVLTNLAANKEFKHRVVKALEKNGDPSWPAKYSKEFYNQLILVIGWAAWSTEYMNEPVTEGKIFINDYIQYKPILKLNQYSRIVSYWDVAYSESKTADCNAVVLAGLYGVEKHIIKSYCRNSTMEAALRWMYGLNNNLPKSVIVEWYAESQFWNTAVDLAMQTVAKEFGYRLPIIFTEKPGKGANKYSRIVQMLPTFQRSEVYFNENELYNTDMQRGIEQLKSIEPGYKTHDDFPDALEGATDKLEMSRRVADSTPIIGMRQKSKRIY
jgi:hypothetical protein